MRELIKYYPAIMPVATVPQLPKRGREGIFYRVGSTFYFWRNSTGTYSSISVGGGASVWGAITGTLSDQTDLWAALNAASDAATWGDIVGTLSSQGDLWAALSAASAAAEWGSLTGTLSAQADLWAALNAAAASATWGSITGTITGQSDLVSYIQRFATNFATASGTNTYTATLSPALASYYTGQEVRVLFTNGNTGTATLNLNGLGAKNIVKSGGTTLNAGDILSGSVHVLIYDGTSFHIQSKSALSSYPIETNAINQSIGAGAKLWWCGMITGNGAGVEANRQYLITKPGVLKDFTVQMKTAQPASGTYVWTVRRSTGGGAAAATPITLTIAANSTPNVFTDNVNSQSVIAGDLISFEALNNATAGAGGIWKIGVDFYC